MAHGRQMKQEKNSSELKNNNKTKGFVGHNFRMFAYMHAFKKSLDHLIDKKGVAGVKIPYPQAPVG